MISRAIVLTVVFTIVAPVVSAFRLGPLFLALFGPFVLWLVPAHLVVALPASGFGAVLITCVESTDPYESGEDLRADSIRLIVLTTLVSLLVVGWLVPWANQASGAAFSRYVDRPVEEPARTPGQLTLDELLVPAVTDSAARAELLQRAVWPAAAFVLPLFATLLYAVYPRWTYRAAVGTTVAVFVACLVFLHRT